MHQQAHHLESEKIPARVRKIEGREWWLWGFAVSVTLVLTFGIVSLTLPEIHLRQGGAGWVILQEWVRGLAALVLLFDIYTVYQHLQLHRIRRELAERNELFRLITENAADMIAVLDSQGHRLYNSPAYQTILGYSPEELIATSPIEQVHPDDRQLVQEAAEKTRLTGRGERLEYRMRHKDGSWRILESTASAVGDASHGNQKLVIVNRDITERKRVEEMLEHHAFHDRLTDLPNRALLLDRLRRACALSRRNSDYKFAVLFIDIDEFRILNDSLGHAAGDELLIQVGRRLRASLRSADTISRSRVNHKVSGPSNDNTLARLGGDEFTVLVEQIRDATDAIRVARRLQEQLAASYAVAQQEVVITSSIGIAFNDGSYAEGEDILRDAEIAMYRAKQAGKARCQVFDAAMHASAVNRLRLETDLRKALEMGEFQVYYQPLVSLQNDEVAGLEALSRWRRPEGIIPPAEFIGVADEIGLTLAINRALLREACLQVRAWHQLPYRSSLSLSVNISPKQFAHPDLVSQIRDILRETAMDPQQLELEITESITMADAAHSEDVLSELKALGVRLSIDDFGTGYSSLSRLQRLPVDTLKIDRSFISTMTVDVETYEIVRSIIMLAHNLGLKVVAEGVETREHVDQLKELGCEIAQGYFLAKPADPAATQNFLQNRLALTASCNGS